MIIVPFLSVHLQGFTAQESQSWLTPYFNNENYLQSLTEFGRAYTVLVDGEVIGCGGIAGITKTRAQAWAIVGANAGKYLFAATRYVGLFLDAQEFKRIETPVKANFEAGHRWARMLGFRDETPDGMEAWGDDGQNYHSFARIK